MHNYCPKETFVGLGKNYGLLIEAILKVKIKSANFYDSMALRFLGYSIKSHKYIMLPKSVVSLCI